MRIGLFGFPQTGKTTLFELLTGATVSAHATRGEAQVAVAKVPDPRLTHLASMYNPKKITPATVEYLDLVGVERGQAAEALPLEQLRTVDALAHVVRGFGDDSVPHTEGDVNPARDVDTMETELLLADHTIAERRVERLELNVRKTNKDTDRSELALVRKALEALEQGTPLRNLDWPEAEQRQIRGFTFLSLKPLLVVVNADEADAGRLDQGAAAFGLEGLTGKPRTEVVALSAKIESEIARLGEEDAASFRADLGIHEPALERMIRASYHLLGRVSFFTVGDDECRAWTVGLNTTARTAAGTIHSDIEKGFIRAEVVAYSDLVAAGSWSAARERATLRLEGRDYIVRDGDVAHFRFNV